MSFLFPTTPGKPLPAIPLMPLEPPTKKTRLQNQAPSTPLGRPKGLAAITANTPGRTVRDRAASDARLLDSTLSDSLSQEQVKETRKQRIWALVERNFTSKELQEKVIQLKKGAVVSNILKTTLETFSRSEKAIHIAASIQEHLRLSQSKYTELVKIMSSTYDVEKECNVPVEIIPGVPMLKLPSSYSVRKWKDSFDFKDIEMVCLVNKEVKFLPVGPLDANVEVLGAVKSLQSLVHAEISLILDVLKPDIYWHEDIKYHWAFSRYVISLKPVVVYLVDFFLLAPLMAHRSQRGKVSRWALSNA